MVYNDTPWNADFFRLLISRVRARGAAIVDCVAAPMGNCNHPQLVNCGSQIQCGSAVCNYTIWNLTGRPNRILGTGESQLCPLELISSNNRQRGNMDMCRYHGVLKGWFSFLWCFWVAVRMVRIRRATRWTVWALSGEQRIQHSYEVCGGSNDMSYPHTGTNIIRFSDSANWVWEVCD